MRAISRHAYAVLLFFALTTLSTLPDYARTEARPTRGVRRNAVTRVPEPQRRRQRFLGWHFAAATRQDTSHWTSMATRRSVTHASAQEVRSNVRKTTAAPKNMSPSHGIAGFEIPSSLPAGAIPTAVVQGDFNEDGKVDLAISNGGDNTIYVLLGNGDGTFADPEVLYTSGQSPVWLTAARLKTNGHLDLVAVDGDSRIVEVFAGNGDGTFQPSSAAFSLSQIPTFVLAGDFNHDGRMDLAVGLVVDGNSTEPQFEVLVGDGSGSFLYGIVPPPIDNPEDPPIPTNWLSIGDLNKDGFTDVVTTVELGASITYLNQKGTAFTQGDWFGPADGAVTTELADMDGDGCLDAVETGGWGLLSIAKGTCDGHFTPSDPIAAVGDVDVAVVVKDVDGDGILDVVSSAALLVDNALEGASGGYLVSVLKGDGRGDFLPASQYRVGGQAFSMVVADLKGNGRPDIVAISQFEDKASRLENDGYGGYGFPNGETIGYLSGQFLNAPIPQTEPLTLDLNGDGKPDVLLIEYPTDVSQPVEATTLLNDGTGRLKQPVRSPIAVGSGEPFPIFFTAGNFRNSSAADLIYIPGGIPAPVAFLAGNGDGSFGAATTVATLPNPSQVVTGDFNGDKKLDFAVVGYTSAATGPASTEIDVFLGNGDGTFRRLAPLVSAPLSPASPVQLIAGDFNHDGKLDLLIGYNGNGGWMSSGDDLVLALGNGDGTFQAPKTLIAHFGPVAVADLNHDGYLDLIQARDPSQNIVDQALLGTGNFVAPAIAVYLGGPGGQFAKPTVYTAAGAQSPTTYPAIVGDFNGDGNVDVALICLPSILMNVEDPQYHLAIFQGVGDGTLMPTAIPYQLPATDRPIAGGDYRGVGLTDLLDLVGSTSSINILRAAPSPQLVLTAESPLVNNSGIVTITLAAPATSTQTVVLAASDPAVQLPSTVTFAAGAVQKSVSYTLGASFDSTHLLTLRGQMNGETATAHVTKANPNLNPHVAIVIGTSFPSQTALTVMPGNTTYYIMTLWSEQGYAGIFGQFSCSGLPPGVSCYFTDSTAQLTAGNFAQVVFSVAASSSAPFGNYSINVGASDGTLSASIGINLEVNDGLWFNPGRLSFGRQVPYSSTSSIISSVMVNKGTTTRTISKVTFAGSSSFTLINGCYGAYASQSSCLISVSFLPGAPGLYSGVISIFDDGGGSPQTIAVDGISAGPNPKLSAQTMNFPQQVVGGATMQNLSLANTGVDPLAISNISIAGSFSHGEFAQTNNCGASVAPGGSCTIQIIFRPSSALTFNGQLRVADNSPLSNTQTATLSGAGYMEQVQLARPGRPGRAPATSSLSPKRPAVKTKPALPGGKRKEEPRVPEGRLRQM